MAAGDAPRSWARAYTVALAAAALLATASTGAAQIKLFPDVLPETKMPAPESVPAPPALQDEPPGSFRVEGLEAPGIDAIGLEGGFRADFYRGAERTLVEPLLAGLPTDVRLPALRDLTIRVLITGSAIGGADGALLEARVDRLVALGDLQRAAALLDQLPPTNRDSGLARLAVEVALLTADDERACDLGEAIGGAGQTVFWERLTMFCRLRDGDEAGAQLAVDLLRETGDDPLTLAVADVAITGDPARPLPALRHPTALQLALLRIAGHPLPAEALADPAPPMLAAYARSPVLVPDLPLDLAEQALLLGALPVDQLRARYAAADPGARPDAAGEAGALARAGAWQRFEATSDPATRARVVEEAWRAAPGEARFVVALVFGPALLDLPDDARTLPGAASIARVLLADGRFLPATRWLALLQAERDPEAAGLAPLFALAGVGGAGQVPVPDRRTLAAWAETRDDPAPELPLLLTLLAGTGAEIDGALWWSQLEAPFVRAGRVVSPAVFRAAEVARAGRRTSEAVLASLALLDGDPTATSGQALVEALRTLRAVGLDGEARGIAIQSALLAGL